MDNSLAQLLQVKSTITSVEAKSRLDAANKAAAAKILLAIKSKLDNSMVESTEYVTINRNG